MVFVVQQFIEKGIHTIPLRMKRLNEVYRRDDNGNKNTHDIQFPKNWNTLYKENFNTKATPLAAALTGYISDAPNRCNIIALDCDTGETYNVFTELDPTYRVKFKSKGKQKGGGTFLYLYTEEFSQKETFVWGDGMYALDILSGGAMVMLPTEHNHTKEQWNTVHVHALKKVPSSVLEHIELLRAKKKEVSKIQKENEDNEDFMIPTMKSYKLFSLATHFVQTGKFQKEFFRNITPVRYRNYPYYKEHKTLHPNCIPQGEGNTYLFRISCILAKTPTINVELFINILYGINNLWDNPFDIKRLHSTIITPMTEGEVCVKSTGKPFWCYSKNFETFGICGVSKNGEFVCSFFDDRTNIRWIIYDTRDIRKACRSDAECVSDWKTITGDTLTPAVYSQLVKIYEYIVQPQKIWGISHEENVPTFNVYKRTACLDVFYNPQLHKNFYKIPKYTLLYLESLIPDRKIRMYILSFLKTKFTHSWFSPVIFSFVGVGGSGKDTFVELLQNIVGKTYVDANALSIDDFISDYTSWLQDKFFVQLSEFSKTSNKNKLKDVKQNLYRYSGASGYTLNIKHIRHTPSTHNATFILTDNNPAVLGDLVERRLLYIWSDTVLAQEKWVIENGGMAFIRNEMILKNELKDFCYYLATEIPLLSQDMFNRPSNSKESLEKAHKHRPESTKLILLVYTKDFDALETLFVQYGITEDAYKTGWDRGRLYYTIFLSLYNKITGKEGHQRFFKEEIKQYFELTRTTRTGGMHDDYIQCDELKKRAHTSVMFPKEQE